MSTIPSFSLRAHVTAVPARENSPLDRPEEVIHEAELRAKQRLLETERTAYRAESDLALAAAPRQLAGVAAAGRSTPPRTPGIPQLPSATLPAMAAARSGSQGHSQISVENRRRAERHLVRSEPTRAEAAVARRLRLASRGKRFRPIIYSPIARISDQLAAWRDGNAGVPALPSTADPADRRLGLTPYLEIRNRHFLDRAERERRRMLTDLADIYRMQAEVRQQVAAAEKQAIAARKLLESMPVGPPEPTNRNAVEQHAPEALVRARRRREFEAECARLVVLDQQAVESARELRVQEAQLSETIAARERILDSRVRQLLQHSLRRCGTYMRHMVRHHPDGTAVIPYLDLAMPSLPDWILSVSSDNKQVNAQ